MGEADLRRSELESKDAEIFAEVARDAEVGELGLVTADGTPRVVPLNFAAVGEAVYFHGGLDEKARALQALMEKYQPEGGFDEIRADDPIYSKALRGVAVFRVSGAWTAKVKFGVNEAEKHRRLWIEKLRERGEDRDLATALEIEKTL
jgi:hypothetical protein